MYQVLIQYFQNRIASFFVNEPIIDYQDLVEHIRKVIPVFQSVDDKELKISYKDLDLDTFINIEPTDTFANLHLSEAFRNCGSVGSDVVDKRVLLSVRETDSPFILKKRSSNLVDSSNIDTDGKTASTSNQYKGKYTKPKSFSKSTEIRI